MHSNAGSFFTIIVQNKPSTVNGASQEKIYSPEKTPEKSPFGVLNDILVISAAVIHFVALVGNVLKNLSGPEISLSY